jgi:Tol biopolymer transport system component
MRATLVLTCLAFPVSLIAQQRPQPVINGGLPSVAPDGGAIAFLSNRSGAFDVYIASPDGQHVMRVTDTPANESAPFWSNDLRLVFSTWGDNVSTVYAASARSPEPTVIGEVSGRSPIISPDGKKLIYSRGMYPSLHLEESALDGSAVRQITTTPAATFNGVYSPDQTQVAFARADSTRQLQVWVMNTDGSGERQLTRFAAADGGPQWPAWSPDGKRLAIQAGRYSREKPDENESHIWIIDVATGAATRLNAHSRYLDETPSWFPDGRRLAFQSDRTGRMEVWVMNADGSGATQITR